MEELDEINEQLKRIITHHKAQIRITVETAYDEAGMVATASGYLRLAQFLVEFVLEAEAHQEATLGAKLPTSSAIGSLFFGGDEVRIDTVKLAATEAEVTQIAEAYLRHSPPYKYDGKGTME